MDKKALFFQLLTIKDFIYYRQSQFNKALFIKFKTKINRPVFTGGALKKLIYQSFNFIKLILVILNGVLVLMYLKGKKRDQVLVV